jgi:CHASE3 domain sensor protein
LHLPEKNIILGLALPICFRFILITSSFQDSQELRTSSTSSQNPETRSVEICLGLQTQVLCLLF